MLISVFGHWINPDNISYLYEWDRKWSRGGPTGTTAPYSTTIYFNAMGGPLDEPKEQGFTIKNKSCKEVAAEINRQWPVVNVEANVTKPFGSLTNN